MKTEENITARVQSTMQILDQLSDVPAPDGLKSKILTALAAEKAPEKQILWLRPVISVAAAMLILALNVASVTTYLKSSQQTNEKSDSIEQIQSEYSLNEF